MWPSSICMASTPIIEHQLLMRDSPAYIYKLEKAHNTQHRKTENLSIHFYIQIILDASLKNKWCHKLVTQ